MLLTAFLQVSEIKPPPIVPYYELCSSLAGGRIGPILNKLLESTDGDSYYRFTAKLEIAISTNAKVKSRTTSQYYME
jgi:hypothetical protein